MRQVSFEAIAGAYENQGTLLHASLYTAAQKARSEFVRTVEPTGVFAAIAAAGLELQTTPDVRLAGQPLPGSFIDALPSKDIAARSLVDIINGSVSPSTGESPAVTFDCPPVGIACGVCDEAEPSFAAMLSYMITGKPHPNREVHSHEIVMGSDMQPVLLRKAVGEQSALNLTPLTIRGIQYPAGSLMQYSLAQDYDAQESWGYTYDCYPLGKDQTRIAYVEEIEQINFLRLSSYAVTAGRARKQLFGRFLDSGSLSSAEAKALWHFELDQVADIAAAVAENALSQHLRFE